METPKTVCNICVKLVLDSEEGLECDGPCTRWFHRECAKMAKTEYLKIANSNLKWLCNRFDCKSDSSTPMDKLLDSITKLSKQISTLNSKVDKLSALPQQIDNIESNLKAIGDKLDAHETRIGNVETKIENIEQKLGSATASQSTSDDIIAEISERNKRASNILIYNLNESTSAQAPIRHKHDLDLIKNMLSAVDPDIKLNNLKCFRVGTQAKGKIRPLKAILSSPSEAKSILRNFKSDLIKSSNALFANVAVGNDRTPKEKLYLDSLKDELRKRSENGEDNLTIKFRNGIPAIVKANVGAKNA